MKHVIIGHIIEDNLKVEINNPKIIGYSKNYLSFYSIAIGVIVFFGEIPVELSTFIENYLFSMEQQKHSKEHLDNFFNAERFQEWNLYHKTKTFIY